MKKITNTNIKVPWGDRAAREINRQTSDRVKLRKQIEKEKQEMLRRKSPEELESDPRTTGAIEALKKAILGKPKKK